jgi:eukaryotic-like serine/threonine-protein kinase
VFGAEESRQDYDSAIDMTIPFQNCNIGGGRYQLSERLASGAMGDVWRATDTLLARQTAVKVLKGGFGADETFLERFRNEAKAAASLTHPAIATVYDYGEEQGMDGRNIAYIVMELVDGESLNFVLRRKGRLSPNETLDIIGQAALALQAAHERGIVHRDIKPANLLIRADGIVKITDFGIARATNDPALTQTGVMFGTVQYMSPEQLTGHSATAASDIYALGVVAFLCCSGHTPFQGNESMAVALAHIRDDVPPLPSFVPASVSALVYEMLKKDPSLRPASAEVVAERARSLRVIGRSATTRTKITPESVPVSEPTRMMTALLPDPTKGLDPSVRLDDQPISPPTAIMFSSAEHPAYASHCSARRNRSWIALALFAVLGLVLLVVFLPSAGVPEVRVPYVSGIQSSAATAKLDRAGLHVRHQSVDGSQPAGLVKSQDPTAGKRVPKGSTVQLRISSGFVNLTASQFAGEPYAQAASGLTVMGLIPSETDVVSSSATGTVLSVTPVGRLKVGTAVSVQVAASAPPPSGPPAITKKPGPGKGHDH